MGGREVGSAGDVIGVIKAMKGRSVQNKGQSKGDPERG